MYDFERQPAGWIRALYPGAVFRLDVGSASEAASSGARLEGLAVSRLRGMPVALTFDDGPTSEHTPWLLERLARCGARATWLLVGHNVERHPELAQAIVAAGHAVGNHTYDHEQRLRTRWSQYSRSVAHCQARIASACGTSPTLFRPPHGQWLPWERLTALEQPGPSKLLFWDVMPGDYDARLSPDEVVGHLSRLLRPGSVVVLHDSAKGGERMRACVEWLMG